MRPTPIILCDVDQVVADLINGWLSLYNEAFDDDLKHEDITEWSVHPFVKPECGKKIYDFLRHPGLYERVKPLPGAKEGIRALRDGGYRVVFVSSCVVDSTDAKMRWLIKHGFLPDQRHQDDFIAAHDKSLVIGHVLIDDKPDNVMKYPGPTILMDTPSNQSCTHPRRAAGWRWVLEYINEFFPSRRAVFMPPAQIEMFAEYNPS